MNSKTWNVSIRVELVSPSMAAKLLESNSDRQRHLRRQYVLRLAKQMSCGNWKLGPDCILLIKNKLYNGQHRLSAVVESGVSCPFLIMESNDESLYNVVDEGLKRQTSDYLIGIENSTSIAAGAKLALACICKAITPFGNNSALTPSRTDILNFIESNDWKEAACFSRQLVDRGILQPSVTIAVYHIGSIVWKRYEETVAFFESLRNGPPPNSPAQRLVVAILLSKNRRSHRMTQSYTLAIALKALKKSILGEPCGQLKIKVGEEMPTMTNDSDNTKKEDE